MSAANAGSTASINTRDMMPSRMQALNFEFNGVKAIRCILSNSVSPATVRFRVARAKEKKSQEGMEH
jgi:hypothetical protein